MPVRFLSAHAAFFGIGAYTSGILTTKFGFHPLAAAAAGMVLCGLVAWFIGEPALRLKGHYLAMATLGFGVIVNIVLGEQVNWTGGPSGLTGIPALRIAGFKDIQRNRLVLPRMGHCLLCADLLPAYTSFEGGPRSSGHPRGRKSR